jgi:hypothetical protein
MLALPPLRARPSGRGGPPKKFLRRNVALISRAIEASGSADRAVRLNQMQASLRSARTRQCLECRT